MSVIPYIVAVLLFLLLIISHEFGHFAFAKLVGVRVNEFSVGMGPLIFHKEKGETEYSLRALPIGGYCKLEGEDGESPDERSFGNQSAWKKLLILFAGPLMNIILALIILSALFTWMGSASTTVGKVSENSPALEAGIMAGDEIISVGGTPVSSWSEIVNAIGSSGSKAVLEIERDGKRLSITSATYALEDGRRVIGITSKLRRSPIMGVKTAFAVTGDFMVSLRDFFARLIRGKVASNDVVGPVGIISLVGESAVGGISNVIFLMCVISLNLGVANLLPFPALDGGRILFVIIRACFKGRISDEAEGRIHTAGMMLLMALMLFLVFKDTFALLK